MTTTIHKNLTGADLHEPKGADTALSGQIYVSDGAGSGSWVAASSVVANAAWFTGQVKFTLGNTAETGWIIWNSGQIGDSSSGASIRANADTWPLFNLLATLYDDTLCPMSGGRGASAALDFAAHKRISLPQGPGRSMGIAGSGLGLTSRGFGSPVGAEGVTLVTANLPPYTPSGNIANTNNVTVTSNSQQFSLSSSSGVTFVTPGSGGGQPFTVGGNVASTFTGVAQGGTSTAVSIMSPVIFQTALIKL